MFLIDSVILVSSCILFLLGAVAGILLNADLAVEPHEACLPATPDSHGLALFLMHHVQSLLTF